MTIEIKLDTPALASLFPEGSAARLNLQQAAIENFSRRHLRGLGTEIEATLNAAKAATIAEIEQKFTVTRGNYSGRTLAPELRAEIEQATKAALTTHINKTIADAADEIFQASNLDGRLTRLLDERLQAFTAKHAEDLLRQRFGAAMQQLTAPLAA